MSQETKILQLYARDEKRFFLEDIQISGHGWSDRGDGMASFVFPKGTECVIRQKGRLVEIFRRTIDEAGKV